MEIVEHDLATVTTAQAYQFDDVLLVRLAGTKPTPCHIVSIEQALTDVEPPAFVARMRIDPRMRCAAVVTDYEVVQAFRIGSPREEVVVHHAGEAIRVDVTTLGGQARSFGGLGGAGDDFYPPEVELTGISRNHDPGEAIRDALANIGERDTGGISDWLSTYTVTDMRVELGGIAGFNQLRVTLRGR
ncbi:hypothetical protein [Georgenia wangjunii]|uniref:hypothetical protein n=1 Tax=Georgenia wangjunii TaxID=3117730 RepID=UPI002F2684E4